MFEYVFLLSCFSLYNCLFMLIQIKGDNSNAVRVHHCNAKVFRMLFRFSVLPGRAHSYFAGIFGTQFESQSS